MKLRNWLVLTVVVLSQVNQVSLGEGVYGSFDLSAYSSYYGRGMLIDKETVVQPSFTVYKDAGGGTMMLNVYGNLDPDTYPGGSNTFNEVDWTFGYTKKVGKTTLSGGLIEYTFSNPSYPDTDTHELYAGASYEVPTWFPATPSITAYYDFKEFNGLYLNAALSRSFTIGKITSLMADTSLGWADANYNKYNFTVDKPALSDWSSGLTLTVTPIKELSLITGIRYGMLVDKEIEKGSAVYYSDSEATTFRVGAIYNF